MSATTVPNPGRALVQGKPHQGPIPRRPAAWLGRTLDASGFAVFLLSMLRISREFGVPLTAATASFAVTPWVRTQRRHSVGWIAKGKVPTPDLEMIE